MTTQTATKPKPKPAGAPPKKPEKTQVGTRGEQVKPSALLTVSEVSALLHIHENTVRLWADAGKLKGYRLGSRKDRRFKPEDVDSVLTMIKPAKKQIILKKRKV